MTCSREGLACLAVPQEGARGGRPRALGGRVGGRRNPNKASVPEEKLVF